MRVEAFLRNSASRNGAKTAIVADAQRTSFADLDRMSDALAGALQRRGVVPGDRVAIFADNCLEAVVSVFGILKAGAVFTPVGAATKAESLAHVLSSAQPSAVLVLARLGPVLNEALTSTGMTPMVVRIGGSASALPAALEFADLIREDPAATIEGLSDQDLAMLIYTSGSTGRSKGVMMTHAAMDFVLGSVIGYLDAREDDVILSVLPMAFSYGVHQVLMAVRTGATLVLEKSFAFPQLIVEAIERERVTAFPMAPAMVAALLGMKDPPSSRLSSLRYVTNAAAELPPVHASRLASLIPGAAIHAMYGQTECKRIASLPPSRLADKPGSVGVAIPGTEAFVIDENGERAGAGVVGELVVKGPHLMRGYWREPEATAHTLRPDGDGVRLHTGDLFRTDEDGFLYFVARKDDIIKSRGEKVAPGEVEDVLLSCPGVVEAVVVARPDDMIGSAIHAIVVVSDPALTPRDIQRHCARRLEDVKIPKTIEFRAELPRTESGKVSRRLARIVQETS